MLYRLYGFKGKNGFQYYVGENELSGEISIKGLKKHFESKKLDFSCIDINSFEESIYVYDSKTRIVYYKFVDEEYNGIRTFTGYMSPYIQENGKYSCYNEYNRIIEQNHYQTYK